MSMASAASEANSPIGGDATKCSRRVRSIESIVQSIGRFKVDVEDTAGKLSASLVEQPAIVQQKDDTTVVVVLFFAFRATPIADDESADSSVEASPVVKVDASYEVQYRLAKGEPISNEDLQAFGDINGRLNLTPYWREYLHDCLSRAGLPPFLIPPFNAAARIAQLKKESRENQEQPSV